MPPHVGGGTRQAPNGNGHLPASPPQGDNEQLTTLRLPDANGDMMVSVPAAALTLGLGLGLGLGLSQATASAMLLRPGTAPGGERPDTGGRYQGAPLASERMYSAAAYADYNGGAYGHARGPPAYAGRPYPPASRPSFGIADEFGFANSGGSRGYGYSGNGTPYGGDPDLMARSPRLARAARIYAGHPWQGTRMYTERYGSSRGQTAPQSQSRSPSRGRFDSRAMPQRQLPADGDQMVRWLRSLEAAIGSRGSSRATASQDRPAWDSSPVRVGTFNRLKRQEL